MITSKYRLIDPFDFEPDIEEIAHALSMLCRYGGHSPRFYSVAEHSVICSLQDDNQRNALALLMHDAAEAYIGDVIEPHKSQLGYLLNGRFKAFASAENVIMANINRSFNLPPATARTMEIDKEVMAAELMSLFGMSYDKYAPARITIRHWDPTVAENMFLDRYYTLSGDSEYKEATEWYDALLMGEPSEVGA